MSEKSLPQTGRRETVIYSAIILLIVVALFAIWKSRNDPRTAELNNMLAGNQEISSFSYPFRVFTVEGSTAVVSTPRSPQMSVLRFLEIDSPRLDISQPDSPEVIAAQKALASVQTKVQEVVKSHPEIDGVRWQLDKQWYIRHGVVVP